MGLVCPGSTESGCPNDPERTDCHHCFLRPHCFHHRRKRTIHFPAHCQPFRSQLIPPCRLDSDCFHLSDLLPHFQSRHVLTVHCHPHLRQASSHHCSQNQRDLDRKHRQFQPPASAQAEDYRHPRSASVIHPS